MKTMAERETVITWDDEQQQVNIYSASPVWWRKLAKLGFVVQRETTHAGEVTGRFYAPVAVADFRFRRKRVLSARQRAAQEGRFSPRKPLISGAAGESTPPVATPEHP